MRSAHYHVLAAPGKLLNVGTVIGQRNRAAVEPLLAVLHMI